MKTGFIESGTEPERLLLGFADQAYLGKNAWWRYLLALFAVFGACYIFVAVLGSPLSRGLSALGAALQIPDRSALSALGLLAIVYALLLGLMLSVFPAVHRRSWRSFLTARPRASWRLFVLSFLVMAGLSALWISIDLALGAGDITFTRTPRRVLEFAPVVLFFLPFQCLAEEVFFRGYVAQAVGRITQITALRLAVPALLFGAAHFDNPEMGYDGVWIGADYLLAGFYLGWLSLKSGGIEASFGLHLANNIVSMLIVGASVRVLPGPSLWTVTAPDAPLTFLTDIIVYSLHYGLVFRAWVRR